MKTNFTKPFREDLGLDSTGFHRIRMGNTVYCVKDNMICTLNAAGELSRVDEATLTEKSWIRRNVNEVLGVKKYSASFVRKARSGYVVDVNDTEYIIGVSAEFTKGFDRNVFDWSAPRFFWSDVVEIKNCMQQRAPAEVVNVLAFQTAVKAALNSQRAIDRAKKKHSMNRWHSRHECEQYKIKKHNTDAFGNTFN
ncbi:hypothetical protein BEN74_18635 [Acinetobacter sp. WCHAc010034]|uniref:hypothetical protein n=1 Tax=Acinetobacter sp. WCHAc010034 TaxID=1879049 RepID=UPI00083B0CA7|nr:hypothetical protein [Acinetobacter sp. WCHAc010034]AYA04602.1 hypothetical protein BEN74_18635 [Acinetobacter sp. WCHAc010034]